MLVWLDRFKCASTYIWRLNILIFAVLKLGFRWTVCSFIIEYRGGKVLQQWRGLDGNWNLQVTFAYLSTDEFLVFYSLEHFLKRPLTRSSPIQSTRRVENEGRAFSILYPLLNFRDQNNTFWPIFWHWPICRRSLCRNVAIFRNSKRNCPERIVLPQVWWVSAQPPLRNVL